MQNARTFLAHLSLMILCTLSLNTSLISTAEAMGFGDEIQANPLSKADYDSYIDSLEGVPANIKAKLKREYNPRR